MGNYFDYRREKYQSGEQTGSAVVGISKKTGIRITTTEVLDLTEDGVYISACR